MERVLVTGGAGFIGSCMVRRLVAAGRRVVTVDLLTYAGRPEAVIHLAAESHVDRSIDAPMDFVTTNVEGTVALLAATTGYWQGLPAPEREAFRFLHVSTDEVYGSLGDGDTGVFTEASPCRPSSPYASEQGGFGPLRPGLAPDVRAAGPDEPRLQQLRPAPDAGEAGAGRHPRGPRGSAHPRLWRRPARPRLALRRGPRACPRVHRRAGGARGVYNVGAGAASTNLDLVRTICARMDELVPDSPWRPHADLVTFVADRPGHDRRYGLDSGRVHRELGWRPAVGLDEGLGRTVRWYLENRRWWREIRSGGFEDRRRQGLGAG